MSKLTLYRADYTKEVLETLKCTYKDTDYCLLITYKNVPEYRLNVFNNFVKSTELTNFFDRIYLEHGLFDIDINVFDVTYRQVKLIDEVKNGQLTSHK